MHRQGLVFALVCGTLAHEKRIGPGTGTPLGNAASAILQEGEFIRQ